MPPTYLFDFSGIDLNKIVYGRDAIREMNPQRGDMEHLDAVVFVDKSAGQLIGYKDVRPDEFWVAGHIPGRPLLPGVIMIEAAAQLASFYTRKIMEWTGFIGFGGVEECKFRQAVQPGCRLYLLAQKTDERHRRVTCKIQGIVNSILVFEATIIGTRM